MRTSLPKAFALAITVLFAAGTIPPVAAQDIMIDEGGPAAKTKKPAIEKGPKGIQKSPRKGPRPRGSSYIPLTTLPRTVAPTVGQPSPGVYRPPPINSFSDRVNNCNHSFPLNAGIGNNPTDRSAYVRQCAN